MSEIFKFKNGQVLKDTVTGFEGAVMSRTEYFTGCRQYALCPLLLTKDKEIPDWTAFDESRLRKTKKKPLRLGPIQHQKEPNGGPMPVAPTRN